MARMTLKSSYVLAFYQPWTKGNSRKEIFEDLQNLLETRTEALSKVCQKCSLRMCCLMFKMHSEYIHSVLDLVCARWREEGALEAKER